MPACPCGSGVDYGQCCQPLHNGQPAASPQALMRSRYAAFAMELADYLRASWDAETRPADLELTADTYWYRLEIHSAAEQGDDGQVHFSAYFREGSEWLKLTELSRFRRGADGFWRYLDGQAAFSCCVPGRNDSCPCGSGRKFKKCCG
ncbi:MAG: SEC-C domain-containing protein [Pseudomonadota bacterium]|nr:SEC-C domain-containing protein [Pseudomonadota bacterium]